MGVKPLAFADLSNDLVHLRKRYLGKRRPVPTNYDLLQGDAFLIAAHAAFEHFFEELCRRAIHTSLWRYSRGRGLSPILDSLQRSYNAVQVSNLPRGTHQFFAGDDLVGKSATWYAKRLADNNGVKRSNLLAMLLPLGFDEIDCDEVWLADMDAFGQLRGDAAHGRPATRFGRSGVTLSQSGPPQVIEVWTQSALRVRTRHPPWDVEATISRLLPETLQWDHRLRVGAT